MERLRIGDTLRYSKGFETLHPTVDGFPNFVHVTRTEGRPKALLEKGINPIATVTDAGGAVRRPAVLISSSPHREGSEYTPWRDLFDVDNGHIRYFGDAKTPGGDPALAPGNRVLLAAHAQHTSFSWEDRAAAPPLLFFRRKTVMGVPKGYVAFQGYGVIERVERVSQFNRKSGATFTNYVFDFVVFSMATEHELFDWTWITARREPALTIAETTLLSPRAWRTYVDRGPAAFTGLRRRAAKLRITRREAQLPAPNTPEYRVLDTVYRYYNGRKHRFEGLAYEIAKRLLAGSGKRIVEGWITRMSGDGGADFIARIDMGEGFGAVRQIIYGQAKCVALSSGTDALDIARTVARLKRGWFGVFVTTSYFSERVQMEVIEDEYPILLVSGLLVAEQTILLAEEAGLKLHQYLDRIDSEFDRRLANRRPEEVLHF
ncbi:restriction endonuclease [Phyllobacterium lublinensis]|uniref:restriction endonuclease n=1 Tax=Phyllobacterium lublinensis TaxID=2875708 RepID=UPI001CCE7223|nr:restriction endonuclease [Phyllobacterium sp. 2063]MBZ9654019.1 restriction endonuclease [Phyllobacterium sp. 2063]